MSNTRIDSLFTATPGIKSTWNDYNVPVPSGVYVYDDVGKVIKIGNGTNIFTELPIWLDIAEINAGVVIDLSRLGPIIEADIGKIMVVDSGGKYVVGSITLAELIISLNQITIKEAAQDQQLAAIKLKADCIDAIDVSDNGSIVAVNSNNKMSGIGISLATNKTSLINTIKYAYGLKAISLNFFIDAACTIPCINFSENLTYYAKIVATDNNSIPITCSLSCSGNEFVVINKLSSFIFSIRIPAIDDDQTLTFTASLTNTYGTKTLIAEIEVFGYTMKFSRNSGNDAITYSKVKMDNNGNFIAVGKISIGGVGLPRAIISKFDADMILLSEKTYYGDESTEFTDVVVNTDNQYIVIGHGTSENEDSYYDGIIISFNDELLVINKRKYTHTQNIKFNSILIDADKNYVIAGESNTSLNAFFILVVKFNKDLNVITKRVFDASKETKAISIKLDNSNKYIVAGEVNGIIFKSGFIMKLDSSLNILSQKVFETMTNFYLTALSIDRNNNYIVVGYGGTAKEAYIIKFNSSLVILDSQIMYGTLNEKFNNIKIDNSNNYILIGTTDTESSGVKLESVLYKLQDTLAVLKKKKISIQNNISIYGITVDGSNNYIVCGSFDSQGFIAKINPIMSTGTLTNLFSQLDYSDCGLLFNAVSFNLVNGVYVGSIPVFSLFDSILNEAIYFDARIIGTL